MSAVRFSSRLRAWLVTGHAEVVAGLAHAELSADRMTARLHQFPAPSGDRFAPLAATLARWPLMVDPPEHGALRAPVTAALSRRVVRSYRPVVRQVVSKILDRTLANGSMEAVGQLAVPVPLYVLGEIIGVPRERLGLLKQCAVDIVAFLGTLPRTYLPTAARARHSLEEADGNLSALAHARRQQPRQDLMSRLLTGGNSVEQTVATCLMMVFAGFETTTNLLANGLLLLGCDRALQAWLRKRPDLLPSAIEEMLRLESPVQRLSRTASMDLELGGAQIKAGDLVFLMTGVANRDPEVFAAPDACTIHRDVRRQRRSRPRTTEGIPPR